MTGPRLASAVALVGALLFVTNGVEDRFHRLRMFGIHAVRDAIEESDVAGPSHQPYPRHAQLLVLV